MTHRFDIWFGSDGDYVTYSVIERATAGDGFHWRLVSRWLIPGTELS